MAEEKKEGLLDQATSFIKDQAGELLSGDTTDSRNRPPRLARKSCPTLSTTR